MKQRVAIFTDDPGWHGARLVAAFAARGIDAHFVSLTDCRLEVAPNRLPIRIPGFEQALPDAAFVRGVPGGSLEQVILRLDVLHALREFGVPVYNDARAIERSVDKAMTSVLLRHHGVPTPTTWITEDLAQARAIVMRETAAGHEVVCKPMFGSQGKGLVRLSAGMDVPAAAALNGVWYLQRYVGADDAQWHDWRVMVIGGRAVAAMKRHGSTWINNVAQGARCEAAALEPELCALASAAARAVSMDYAGVDLIADEGGRLQVLEVNSIPAWKGLQGVTELDLAQALVDDLVDRHLRAAPHLELAC